MPPANTQSYHVCGPVAPQCNIGSASAYVTLGVCHDGARIEITPMVHGVKSDGGGGPEGGEVEWVGLNAIATIRFKLVPYAGNYVNKLRAMSVASATEGVLPTPGILFGLNSFLPALYLPSADGDGPWFFPNCRVVKPGGDNQVATKETMPDWEFRAMVYYNPASANSISGGTLYTRAAPS